MNAEEQYTKITQQFLEQMSGVSASPEEFIVAMRTAIDEIEIAIDAVEEDINRLDGEAI